MTLARCVAVVWRTINGFILFALFSVVPAAASRWDSAGAARDYQKATQKRSELAELGQPTPAQYFDCANTYRSVYIKDPHYSRTGDAIYQEALLYQEMGNRFSKDEYYKTAVKRFRLLIKDYGGSSNCPDALIRLGDIYSLHLNDEKAAQEAYQYLKTQYGYSKAAIQRMQAKLASKSIRPETARKADLAESPITAGPAPAAEFRSKPPSIVQSVRFWSTSKYTRVIIDMDSEARYEKSRLYEPDRIYFDISNAKLSHELLNRTFTLKDEVLKQVRVGQNRTDMVRVVLDISDMSGFSVSELYNPFRIVIDLQRKRDAAESHPPDPGSSSKSSSVESKEIPATPLARKTVPELESQPPKAITEIRPSPPNDNSAPSTGPKESHRTEVTTANAPTKTQPVTKPQRKQPEPKSLPPVVGEVPVADTRADSAIKAAPASKAENSIIPREAAPTSHGDRTLTRTLGLKVGRIVIDPGHGGHDLGTIGPAGLQEKNLVLSLAHRLQKILEEKLGAEVILTRDDDTYLSLEERTAIANEHRADLFISLHANSSRIHSISGVETYYLDFAKNDAEREIAARENATTESNVRNLEDLIKKIAKADKSAESRELASIIQQKLYTGARKFFPATQNRGVRSAPFIVLIGANMPSVLAEVAFISNPNDERLLSKEVTRQNLVKALYAGIEGYIKTLGSDMANNQTGKSK